MTETINQINFVKGRAYKGDNAEILHNAAIALGYTSNEWATMRQWNQVQRSVAKGEGRNGVAINYTRILESDQGPVKEKATAWVYNRCQLRKVNNT